MPETLLRAKLFVPPLRPNLVPRPNLIERINRGMTQGCKLTLVSAPAGFGKTTLVSAWTQEVERRGSERRPVAWLSLDAGDNERTRFLAYFIAALQTIDGNVGQGLLAALQSPGGINVEAVLTALLNELAEFPDQAVLVLDDYHVIESRPVDEALTFLLEHLPPQMHLVISSRIDPSLPLSRLRAGRLMNEIRVDDLRFTTGEAAAFLNQVMGFDLSAQDIAALETRTEGWIAGLQLAALSMQGSDDGRGFIRSFSGSNRYIQDYLVDEVLQRQPRSSKDFLLQTSILHRLSGPLCDAVRFGIDQRPTTSPGVAGADKTDSQAILERLEAANLFLVPLDNERRWYRYHHLFAGLLAHRLRLVYPDLIPDLHRRASIWYEKEGYLDDAIHHAQAAGDDGRLADIIEEHWQDIVHRGEATRLRQLLDSVGPGYTKKSAPLSMAYCWIHVLTGEIDSIATHVKDIEEALEVRAELDGAQQPTKLAVIPSLVRTMEATLSLENGQARKAREQAQEAISLIPADLKPAVRMLLHGAAGYRLALAHRALGEYDQACAVWLAGLEMLKASGNYYGAAATVLQIVAAYKESGKSEEAITLCEEMLDYIEAHHWQKMPPSGMVNVVFAGLLADAGHFAEAEKNLEIGRGLVEQIETQYTINLVKDVEEKLYDSGPPPQPLVEPLSPRELEVLQMIAQGLSNREISKRLFLALDTVKGHNRRIFGKLGVKNRTQAANKAINLKLIPPQ